MQTTTYGDNQLDIVCLQQDVSVTVEPNVAKGFNLQQSGIEGGVRTMHSIWETHKMEKE